jgi:dedicator of cytokinesis protein 6/7/8
MQRHESGTKTYAYSLIDYEDEFLKWAKENDSASEALLPSSDDVREITRERSFPADSRLTALQPGGPSNMSAKHAPHLHAVQTALRLYSSDWRGIERHYKNMAIRSERAVPALQPPLFESGPNIILPEFADDEDPFSSESDLSDDILEGTDGTSVDGSHLPSPDAPDSSEPAASDRVKRYRTGHKPMNSTTQSPIVKAAAAVAADPSPAIDASWADPIRPELLSNDTTENGSSMDASDTSPTLPRDRDPSITAAPPRPSRRDLFSELYPIDDPPEATLVSPPFSEKSKFSFLFEPKELSFSLQLNEPFFCSASLYDMTKKQKLSENFYFESISSGQGATTPRSKSPLNHKALFCVPSPSADIWLVIKVDKVLLPESYDSLVEPYSKFESLKEKDRDRLVSAAAAATSKLSRFKTPFVWTLLPLFTDDKQLALGLDSKITTFYRWKPEIGEQVIFDTYAEYSKTGSSSKRTRNVTGKFVFDTQQWTPQLEAASSRHPQFDSEGSVVTNPLESVSSDAQDSSSGRSRSSSAPPALNAEPILPVSGSVIRKMASFGEDLAPAPFTQLENSLYVYPLSGSLSKVNSSSGVAPRNVVVQLQLLETDDLEQGGLNVWFNRTGGAPSLSDKAISSVQYHERSPVFQDEVKLSLPLIITSKHNLVFTFFHVACKPDGEEGNEDLLTPVGHAFMPLLFRGRFVEKDITLPIASTLPKGYMSPEGEAALRSLIYDPKKAIFKFRLRLASTIYTSEKNLNTFFTGAEAPTRESLRALLAAPVIKSIQYLPSILNLLFAAMHRHSTNGDKEGPTVETFNVLVELLHRLHTSGETDLNTLLNQYIDHVFMQQPIAATSSLYRIFTSSWAAVLEKAAIHGQIPGLSPAAPSDVFDGSTASLGLGSAAPAPFAGSSLAAAAVGAAAVPGLPTTMPQSEWERLHRFAGFFLRVIGKSMAAFAMYGKEDQSAKRTKRREREGKDKPHRRSSSTSVRSAASSASSPALPSTPAHVSPDSERRDRFDYDYLASLRRLVVLLTWEVQLRMRSGLTLAKEIIKKLASFFSDLAAVCDRGYIIDLVHHVVDEQLTLYPEERLEFLRVLANYEHFALLSLPVSFKLDQNMISNLDSIWRQRHYLSLTLCKLALPSSGQDKALRLKTLNILHMLFFKHDVDPRMKSKKVKQRVMRSYWPLLVGAVDCLDDLRRADFDEQRAVCAAIAYILRHVDRRLLSWWWRKDTLMRQVGFLQLTGLVALVFEHVGERTFTKRMAQTSDSSKTSLQTKAMLEAYFTDPQGTSRVRYQSLREKRLAAARQSSTTNVPLSARSAADELPEAPSGTWGRRWKHTFGSSLTSEGSPADPYDDLRESSLAQEIGLTVADVLAYFVEEKTAELGSFVHPNLLMDSVMSITFSMLQRRYPVSVQLQILAFVRTLVHRYPKQFFTLNNTYCAVLCSQLLSLCQFHNLHVRVEATALLFLLMKKNFEHSSSVVKKRHFSRVKVQSIIALSKLVGGGRIKEPAYLLRALQALEKYANHVASSSAELLPLCSQVQLLVDRLRTIMQDSVKINLHRNDPEMLADLYHRIAASYRNAPDLRVTWLESLAEIHAHSADNAAWAEAAQSRLHIAALVAEYLDRLEPVDGLPPGCSAFEPLCPSASEEQAMLEETFRGLSDSSSRFTDRLGDGLDGGVDEAHLFTETTLVSVCEGAADYLTRAHLYEAASEVFKLLVRVHDKNRDHAKLGIAYAAMSELHHKIRDAELTHSRVLGSYYRVAFFGSKFGELDGLEYIYKEPRLTRLGEICDRLTSLFSSKLGPGTAVELYTKSGDVDRSKLDPAKCYIQITSVSPYFEEWELKDRKTDFERNFNISTFIFETPFTKGGKSHATSLSEQFKLRTILSVEASFPYMKKRLLVTSKRTEEVSPIENSLELIKKRNAALREELLHPTAKTLQPVLQGSVRLQVHAGPTEICKTFLADSAKYPARSVQELRRCLQEFLDVCGEALSKNRELITSSQLSFHQELEDGFAAVRAEMEPFLVD